VDNTKFCFPLPWGKRPKALPGYSPLNLPRKGRIPSKAFKQRWQEIVEEAQQKFEAFLPETTWWNLDEIEACNVRFIHLLEEALTIEIRLPELSKKFNEDPFHWTSRIADEWTLKLFGQKTLPDNWSVTVGPVIGSSDEITCIFKPKILSSRRWLIFRVGEYMKGETRSINGPIRSNEIGLIFPRNLMAAIKKNPLAGRILLKALDLFREELAKVVESQKKCKNAFSPPGFNLSRPRLVDEKRRINKKIPGTCL